MCERRQQRELGGSGAKTDKEIIIWYVRNYASQ